MPLTALAQNALPARTFDVPVRVYYADTDAAGVVYYANYLRFCEAGRTEWFRACALGRAELAHTEGLVFVVRSVHANYFAPAMLDDALVVRTTLTRLGGASLRFQQKVLRQTQVLFEADIVVACVDRVSMKSVPIPQPIRQFLANTLA